VVFNFLFIFLSFDFFLPNLSTTEQCLAYDWCTRTTVGETLAYSILVPHFLCEISGSHGGWYEGDSLLLYSAV
jgi:hypothetical protein